MEQQLQDIREQQKVTWNKFSSGWKKWDDLTMDFLKPMGDAIIDQLHLNDTDVVLDVAAGTGEPGLSIATRLTRGKVIINDLSDDMLVVAHEKAADKGVKNVEFFAGDVCELPFDDNSFDAISCRFGFMFFPDMLMAVKEMVRVLKPGGRISTAVWNTPDKNFWITATMGPLNAGLFAKAGLKNVTQQEVTGVMECKTTDVYWDFMTDVVAPVVAALSKADDATKGKIRSEVYQSVNNRYPDGNVSIASSALVISGVK